MSRKYIDNWVRKPQSSRSGDKFLCERCRTIDFKTIFRIPIYRSVPGYKRLDQDIPLGWLHEVGQRIGCSFCRLLKQTLQSHYKECDLTPAHWRDGSNGSSGYMCYVSNYCEEANVIPTENLEFLPSLFHLEIYTFPALERSDLYSSLPESTMDSLLPKIQLIFQKNSPGMPARGHGRVVPKNQVNFALLQKWLSLCNQFQHFGGNLPFQSSSFANFRVIDVNREYIRDAPSHCTYLALSYVWGKKEFLTLTKENRKALQSEGGLARVMQLVPLTVRDAMLLVKKLDEQYLWVDSLCIVQDDEEDRYKQIAAMDRVYRSAKLTVIAVSGRDAEAGLPGVRCDSRYTNQAIEEVQSLTLANMLPGKREIIDRSLWNQRGWTYQERLFSRRLLFFAQDQVYFECEEGCNFREDCADDEFNKADFYSKQWQASPATYALNFERQINFNSYALVVKEYSKRKLTQSSDGLNAFSAILSAFQHHFRGRMLYGLPETALDAALLWRPTNRAQKRLDFITRKFLFPSWSWLGWENEVGYPESPNICEITRSKVVWLSLQDNGVFSKFTSESCGKPPALWPGWKHWERIVEDDEIYYREIGGDPSQWFCHPITAQAERANTSPMEEGSGLLRFRAMSAFFELTGQHTRLLITGCRNNKHMICNLSAINREGHRAGTVALDSILFNDLGSGNYEFVAISQTTLHRSSVDPSWDPATQTYLLSQEDREVILDAEEGDSSDGGLNFYDARPREEVFDQHKYDKKKYWCLYNALMIEWRDGIAYRLGIGYFHVDAFDSVASEKLITLG